jgi:hypothetical protein
VAVQLENALARRSYESTRIEDPSLTALAALLRTKEALTEQMEKTIHQVNEKREEISNMGFVDTLKYLAVAIFTYKVFGLDVSLKTEQEVRDLFGEAIAEVEEQIRIAMYE